MIATSHIGHDQSTPRRLRRNGWPVLIAVSTCLFLSGWFIFCKQSAAKHTDKISDALFNSLSFRSLHKQVERPAALVDREDETFVEFAIGETFPDHFLRMESLRINKKTFQVSKLTEDDHLEYQWIDE